MHYVHDLMRHSSLKITEKYYLDVDDAGTGDAIEWLPDFDAEPVEPETDDPAPLKLAVAS